MIDILFITIIIFIELLFYVVFADVILSWLMLMGINFRPKFIADIIDPIYKFIKSIIPTSIGPLDFTPIVFIIFLYFVKGLVIILNPGVKDAIDKLLN